MPSEAEALRDSFQDFAEALEPVVQQLQIAGSSDYRQVENARINLVSAAAGLNTAQLSNLFAGSSDLTRLKLLADEIDAKANGIANQERNVARIVGIGAGALSILHAAQSLDVAGVLSGVKNVTAILD